MEDENGRRLGVLTDSCARCLLGSGNFLRTFNLGSVVSVSSTPLLVPHASCLPIGTVIADFEIIGLVGEGGFGIVYLARDTNLDRVVALKEYMPAAFAGRVDGVRVAVRTVNSHAMYEAGLRSFINEAKMLAKFAHPALVEVYRFWEGNGTAYMAMRFYSGETLRQCLTRGDRKFDEESIAQIMAPIFDTLEMLHREQIFHRDIAPDNIMLSDGRSVLLDFGSARRIIGGGTQALTTILKPGYAPVEQYVDDGSMKQGPWTDVYALGGVLYHLATGKAPLQAVSRLLSDPLRSVNEVTDGAFSSAFSNAVAKAMAVRVEDRLQNISEFTAMLGWNTVQSTRIVTVPSAPLARPAIDKETGDRQEPTAQVPSSATTAAPASELSGLATADMSVGGERPAYPAQAQATSIRKPVLAAAVGVVVVAAVLGYGYLQRSETAPGTQLQAGGSPAAALPAMDSSAAASSAARVPQTEASAALAVGRVGVVRLNITPWGTVVIDGITRGISNASQLREIELPVGTHTIEIAKPDALPMKQTIEVGDTPLAISHAFK